MLLSRLPPNDDGQWWELSDETREGLPYYYHTATGETRWEKPTDEFVIPLRVIQVCLVMHVPRVQTSHSVVQTTTLGRRLSVTAMSKRASVASSRAPRESTVLEGNERPASIHSVSQGGQQSQSQRPRKAQRSASDYQSGNTPNAGAPSKPTPVNISVNTAQNGKMVNGSASGNRTPTSPTRPRAATALIPTRPQQSLDAAAHMLASGSGSSPQSREAPRSSSTSASAMQSRVNGQLSAQSPAKTTHLQTADPATGSDADGVRKGALNANGNTNGNMVAAPVRRVPPVPQQRPRRHTNAALKDISAPIMDAGKRSIAVA